MSKQSVKFHIKSGDYFGTIATVLSLIRQSVSEKKIIKTNERILKRMEKDLMYLQKEYKIIKNK